MTIPLASGRFVTRRQVRDLDRENRRWPETLVRLPDDVTRTAPERCAEVWRSRGFLVQVYVEAGGIERLSVSRTTLREDGRWEDGLSWDDLQRLKGECGRGDRVAVEVYPPNAEIVNDANMRHLWVLPVAPSFMWRRSQGAR